VTAQDPIAELTKSLRIAGIGDNEVKSCLANDAVAKAVVADFKGGETLGVSSTPTLFIGGQMYKGSRSIDDLEREIAKHGKQ
jgi:protein-disulfide isomerase